MNSQTYKNTLKWYFKDRQCQDWCCGSPLFSTVQRSPFIQCSFSDSSLQPFTFCFHHHLLSLPPSFLWLGGRMFFLLLPRTHCACLVVSQFPRVSWANVGAESTLMMNLDTHLLLSHDHNKLGEALPLPPPPLHNTQLLQTLHPWCWCLLPSEPIRYGAGTRFYLMRNLLVKGFLWALTSHLKDIHDGVQ